MRRVSDEPQVTRKPMVRIRSLRLTHAGRPWLHLRSGLVVGLLIALVMGVVCWVGGFNRTELRTLDLRYLARFLLEDSDGASQPVMVVAIDERSLASLGPWPWPYDVQARLVEALSQAGAEGIGLSYLLPSPGNPQSTARFEQALRDSGTVVLAAAFQGANDVTPPDSLIQAAASVGSINLEPDRDGVVRRIPARSPQARFASFTLAYARAVGVEEALTASDGAFLVNYRPPANEARIQLHRWMPTVSAVDVLEGVVSPHIKGKYVVVGITSPVATDQYNTPLLQQVPGVYIHAFALRSWLARDPVHVVQRGITLLSVILFALICSAMAFWLRPWVLTVITLVAAGATTLLAAFAFIHLSLWVEVVPLLATLGGTYVAGLAYAYSVVDRDTRRTRHLFRRYVAPEVVDRLLRGLGDIEAGRRAEVTILFADIRGFTSFAERSSPERAVETLDRYLQVMADSVLAHGGMLDKYIGDAVMAVFGAPLERSDHAQAALLAALDIRRKVDELGTLIEPQLGQALRVGIGVHSGEAVVGSIGSPSRREYTAIGDAVNVASRLEEAAGPGEILLSQTTVEACGIDPPGRAIAYKLRGRHDPVVAFRLAQTDEPFEDATIVRHPRQAGS